MHGRKGRKKKRRTSSTASYRHPPSFRLRACPEKKEEGKKGRCGKKKKGGEEEGVWVESSPHYMWLGATPLERKGKEKRKLTLRKANRSRLVESVSAHRRSPSGPRKKKEKGGEKGPGEKKRRGGTLERRCGTKPSEAQGVQGKK